jgi:hypothetical protein
MKEEKKCSPVAQTSRNDSFGLVLLIAAALIHPELIVRCLRVN